MGNFSEINPLPSSLFALNNPPQKLFYQGDLSLLNRFKVAIVGTRSPNQYTKMLTARLSNAIAKFAVVVSGGALGVDIIAHRGAYPNTIMVSPSSLDIIYPRENEKMISDIAKNALIISEYKERFMPHRHSFLERNRIVIALSDIVILPQGDLRSGTYSSANFAMNLNKPIFTLPHRYDESSLTNFLLSQNKAKAIYNINDFIKANIPHSEGLDSAKSVESSDEILAFCAKNPSYDEAVAKFGNKILEYEFEGLLVRENNIIRTKF